MMDAESESVYSDYSEITAPLKYFDSSNPQGCDTYPRSKSPSPCDIGQETSEERAKREKKINILSLAQEFANLKKLDSSVLPFDLHKQLDMNDAQGDVFVSTEDNGEQCKSGKNGITSAGTLIIEPRSLNHQFASEACDASRCDPADINFKKNTVYLSGSQETSDLLEFHSTNSFYSDSRPMVKSDHSSIQEYSELSSGEEVTAVNLKRNSLQRCELTNIEDNNRSVPNKNRDVPENFLSIVGSKMPDNQEITSDKLKSSIERNSSSNYDVSPFTAPKNIESSSANKQAKRDVPKNFAKISKEALPPKNYDAVVFGQDFDVYNIESTLPEMDWVALESRLTEAADEDKQRQNERTSEREQIRRKLAMGIDEDVTSNRSFSPRRSSLQSRLNAGASLQICFMNDCDDLPPVYTQPSTLPAENVPYHDRPITLSVENKVSCSRDTLAKQSSHPVSESHDILQQQAYLQAEAKLALAQASTMARMQLEIDKQALKRVSLADMVGISYACEGDGNKLTLRTLQMMNLAQIQVIVNDLHSQIEAHNDELVRLLIDRDDLHMEQDSMLVDIEDLTRRAKELSDKLKMAEKQKSATRRK